MADYSALYRLAPFDVSAPRADFFTPLSQIANQISRNRQVQADQALREQALAQQNANTQASQSHQAAALAESARHNRAIESVSQAASRRADEEVANQKRSFDVLRSLGIGGPQTNLSYPQENMSPVGIAPDVNPLSPKPIASQGAPGVHVAGPAQSVNPPDVAGEVDRLQKALLVPNLPTGAKLYIQERLKTLNPDFNKTPAGAGMIEQAKEEAKASVKAETEARDEEQKAYASLNRFSILKPLADKLKTGATLPGAIKVGSFAKSLFGENSGPILSSLGLKPDDIGNAQAFNSLANQSIAGLIGPGGLLPANNFTEKDRELILSTIPSLGDDPRAVALKIELANEANRLITQRGDEWRRYKQSHQGARYNDFLDIWNSQLSARQKFGDVARQAEELLKNTQPGGVNAPNKSGKLSNGLQWSVE